MLNGLDLFSGIGGITLALQDWVRPVAYCEIEPFCQSILLQRMQEGNLPKAPIWDDVRTLPIHQLPPIDIIYGGFPCQDISIAGAQRGLEGKRSGLVFEIFRIAEAVRPAFIFLENVPNIRTKGAERVCKELAERGYDSRWCCLSASDVGARHKRERWWLLAHTMHERCNNTFSQISGLQSLEGDKELPYSECKGFYKGHEYQTRQTSRYSWLEQSYWTVEPDVGRVVTRLSHRVDRIKALGNSVVPLCAKTAFVGLIYGWR